MSLYSNPDTISLVLSAGDVGSPYYQTAVEISEILNQEFQSTAILAVPSTGSIDNLERLKERSADFAIVQRDVAVELYYDKKNTFKNWEIVMPLFPEALHIIVRGRKGAISYTQFEQMINSGEISSFAMGSPTSATYLTTKRVLNVLGINIPDKYVDSRPFRVTVEEFRSGTISAIAQIVAQPQLHLLDLKGDSVGILNMNENELNLARSHLINLDRAHISGSSYPFLPDELEINTVGTWAFLISHSGLSDMISEREKAPLLETTVKRLLAKQGASHLRNSLRSDYGLNVRIEHDKVVFQSIVDNESHFFRGLPICPQLETMLGLGKWNWAIQIATALIIFLFIIALYSYVDKVKLYRLWLRYRHFIIAVIVIIITYFITLRLIFYFEESFYANYLIRSSVLDLSNKDLSAWLLLFVLASYTGNVFPISQGGQILVTISLYLWFGTIGIAAVAEYFFRQYKKKRKEGMANLNLSNHFVICGWNERGKQFLSKARTAMDSYVNGQGGKIVVISTKIKKEIDEDDFFGLQHDLKNFEFIHGEPTEHDILKRAHVTKAKTVILLADDDTHAADERTFLRAMAISSYCHEIGDTTEDNIYIIAELNTSKLKTSLLKTADVNEVVTTSEIGSDIILQGMFNHGISEAIESILTYNEFNEFYTVDLREYSNLRGHTYDELLIKLREKGILLLGIRSVYYDNQGMEIIDTDILSKMMEEDSRMKGIKGTKRLMMINPVCESERSFRTDEDDQLIVLAFNGHDIERLRDLRI